MPLRDFLGINPEIENPIYFNINKYMGKSGKNPTLYKYNLSRFMKMSDYFFTYFLEEPCCYCNGIICPIVTASLTLLFVSGPFITFFVADNVDNVDIVLTVIMIIIMLTIPSIFILLNILAIIKHSLRIDIIYSKDFDRIFIGLLNHNGTSYKKTFIHSINSIN